ncbi:MAG: Tex family protein, partial [Planctomycetota bacterium]
MRNHDLIAGEIGKSNRQVAAALRLMDEGGTVPFIARYRKEATGGLGEVDLQAIEERRRKLAALDQRREAVLASIVEQGRLTDDLSRRVAGCATRTELEDLYLPYRPKRKTRATMARARGLEALADRITAQPSDGDPHREARAFVDPDRDVPDIDAALAGARDIVAEKMAERADLRALARDVFHGRGKLVSKVVKKKIPEGGATRFTDYYDYAEPVSRIPSHRFLAVRRGEREGLLRVKIDVDTDNLDRRLLAGMRQRRNSPFAGELAEAVTDGRKRLLGPAVEKDVLAALKERSDLAAVEVFAENLKSLLLAAPLGEKAVLAIDPGFRSGIKCSALDATGRFLEHRTFFPFDPRRRTQAQAGLWKLVEKHRPDAIAVGNGTASRETMAFVKEALAGSAREGTMILSVSEAGASVYSASETARDEFPDLDLTVRGAISIGRRLQDPLAELVKVEPRAVGVGQYQHDVHQPLLGEKLDQVVLSCVNRVGVELNTASAHLLSRVAGLKPTVAKNILTHREANGAFRRRRDLLDVKGLGPRAYEQAAGFLRIRGAANPLDASAVHPERYGLVERMAADLGTAVADLVGNAGLAGTIEISRYVGGDVGEPTLRDIVDELSKPGRDPRAAFEAPGFRDDVNKIDDVEPGMTFTGVVTNVTAFGAFVDIGVHQDGLVHISQLADHFVKDPHREVHAGQTLSVRVLSVDLARKRISLTAKKG